MKKRLLVFALLVVAMCCLLAASVSAENRTSISYTDINGVTHDVPVVKYEDATAESVASILSNNSTVQARFIDNGAYAILKATDGSLTAYPTWYIIEPSGNDAKYVAISEIEYGYVNAMSGKTYNRGAILYVEFPEGMTHLRGNSVFGGSTGKYEVNVTEIVIPSTVIATQNGCFNGAPSLKKVFIKENSQMTTIAASSFTDSKNLTYIQFENLSRLESIDGVANCNLTGKIDLSKNTNLKSLPNQFLQNNPNVTEIALPDSIETIGNKVFEGCTNIRFSSPYLPKNLVSIGTHFMTNCKNINETLIFPEGFTTITDECFTNASIADAENGTLNLVFLGEPTKLIMDGSTYTGWAKYVNVYFAKYTISDFKGNVYSFSDKEAGTLSGKAAQSGELEFDVASKSPTSTSQVLENHMRFFFCGENGKVQVSYMLTNAGTDITEDRGTFVMDGHTHYGACALVEATCGKDGSETISCIVCDQAIVTTLEATGNHNHVDGICTVCGHSLCPGGADHNMKLTIAYENGYINAGKVINKCQNEGCTHEEYLEAAAAILTFKGYSAKIGGTEITVGYTVNQDALSKYEEITGEGLRYGVVAYVPKVTDDKTTLAPVSIVNGDAVGCERAIAVEMSSTYTAFDFILSGFTEEYYNTEIVLCAFVCVEDAVEYISYNNNKEAVQYEYAYSVSFNGEATEE